MATESCYQRNSLRHTERPGRAWAFHFSYVKLNFRRVIHLGRRKCGRNHPRDIKIGRPLCVRHSSSIEAQKNVFRSCHLLVSL